MTDENPVDRVTGKPRLMGGQCATCIGRPGNPMDLRSGRVRQMTRDACQGDTQGIICHETLSYGGHPEHGGPAFCRWFYDTFGYQNNYFRIVERLGGFTEVRTDDKSVLHGG
jgi:hypothetical protein